MSAARFGADGSGKFVGYGEHVDNAQVRQLNAEAHGLAEGFAMQACFIFAM